MKIYDTALILIRTDCSATIGSGHMMRCLALAQAWVKAGGRVVFSVVNASSELSNMLISEGMSVINLTVEPGSEEDAKATVDIALFNQASWVAIDGSWFGPMYQRVLKDAGLRVLWIDDGGSEKASYADVVLNQNIHADESMYPARKSYTRYLLGTQYTLLRNEFLSWDGWERSVARNAKKILITIGGGDEDNITSKILEALRVLNLSGLGATVVVGDNNPHYKNICRRSAALPMMVEVKKNVRDMAQLMVSADVAVTSGGYTVWELAYMGLNAVVGCKADIEVLMLKGLAQLGLFARAGWFRDLSEIELADYILKLIQDGSARAEVARRGRELIDGKGYDRVLQALCG